MVMVNVKVAKVIELPGNVLSWPTKNARSHEGIKTKAKGNEIKCLFKENAKGTSHRSASPALYSSTLNRNSFTSSETFLNSGLFRNSREFFASEWEESEARAEFSQ
jgi:hypothetical protein